MFSTIVAYFALIFKYTAGVQRYAIKKFKKTLYIKNRMWYNK